jgi:hypothetical protein
MGYTLRTRKVGLETGDAMNNGSSLPEPKRKRTQNKPSIKLPFKKSDKISTINGIPDSLVKILSGKRIYKVSDLGKKDLAKLQNDANISENRDLEWLQALHYLAITPLKEVDLQKLSPSTWTGSKAPKAVASPVSVPFSPPQTTSHALFSPNIEKKVDLSGNIHIPTLPPTKEQQFIFTKPAEPVSTISSIPPEALERRPSKEDLRQQKEQLVHIPTGKALQDVVDPILLSEAKDHLKATLPPNVNPVPLRSPKLAPTSPQLEPTSTHTTLSSNLFGAMSFPSTTGIVSTAPVFGTSFTQQHQLPSSTATTWPNPGSTVSSTNNPNPVSPKVMRI